MEAEAGGVRKKRDISMVDYADYLSEAMSDSEGQGNMDYDDRKEENNFVADDGQPTYDDSVDIKQVVLIHWILSVREECCIMREVLQ